MPLSLQAEFAKLRRSHLAWMALAAPMLVVVAMTLGVADARRALYWGPLLRGGSELWSSFLLPMLAMGLALVMAQVEYRAGAWGEVLSGVRPRWTVFAAKGVVFVSFVLGASLVMLAALPSGLALAGLINPRTDLGGAAGVGAWQLFLRLMAAAAASAPWAALLFWVCHRRRGLTLPIVLGMGGILAGVMARGQPLGRLIPSVWPFEAQQLGPAAPWITLGCALLGAGLFALSAFDLSSRPPLAD